ncbi:MAG TPA: acyltransferase family protein [Microthrixaceae bacterium]|nr:acyltransferase family protein [Microthrixaceae bacterium]
MAGPAAGHRNDIQALRGLAVLVVVAFHAEFGLEGGFVGVDAFFVISGFVISGLISGRLGSTGRLDLRDFYARRARRLLPSLAIVSIVSLLASIPILAPNGIQQAAARSAAAASAFSANLYLYRFGVNYFTTGERNPFLHTWSLGVEEQTYLVLPFLMAVAWAVGRRAGRPRLTLAAIVATGTAVSMVLGVWMSTAPFPFVPLAPKFAFYGPVTRFWEFGAGVLLALAAQRLVALRPLAPAMAVVGVVVLVAVAVVYDQSTVFPGWAAPAPVAATGLLLAAGTASADVARWVAWRPLVWLGDLSYGWYLWHWPLIVFARALWHRGHLPVWTAAVVSLGLAVLSRSVYEDRLRHDTTIVGRKAVVMAVVCIVPPMLVAGGVLVGAEHRWWNDELQARAAEGRLSGPERDGCDAADRSKPCHYGTGAATVTLVGDSHAGTIADVVRDVVLDRGASFDMWSHTACPFLLSTAKRQGDECQQWSEEVADYLVEHPTEVVVIHVAATVYTKAGRLQDADGRTATSAGETIDDYVTGLEEVVEALEAVGSTVLLIEDIPDYVDSTVEFANLVNPSPTPETRNRAEVERSVAPLHAAIEELAGRTAMLRLDPVPLVCGEQTCSQWDGEWLYRDKDHLTPGGAARLRPALAAAVQEGLAR